MILQKLLYSGFYRSLAGLLDRIWNFWVNVDHLGSLITVPFDYSDIPFVAVFSMLYASIVIFCIGHKLGNNGSGIFAISVTFPALIGLSTYIYHAFDRFWYIYFRSSIADLDFGDGFDIGVPVVRVKLGNWISSSTFEICWGFVFDPLTITMMWVVLFITFVVQIYCLDYMAADPFQAKFYSYLSVFSFFMLFLVSADNYLQIFLGWEGVGLISFILISFRSSRTDAISAGMKAMFVNRFGDLFFIAATVICLDTFATLNIENITFFVDNFELPDATTLCLLSLCLIIAAMAKSAQLGLHMWLPDAMEGPTPVSALIHAATMVTAGIFVLIRSSPVMILAPDALGVMALIGGLTALFGASVACVQFDIKKVIAYSTCSQLGYMMFACGAGNFTGAFFHPVNHAFFKAALFLGAGSVIHAMNNEQDMRKMGALINFLPVTFGVMVISSAALAGFPFLSGFYSKDYVLEFSYSVSCATSTVSYIFGLIGAFGTSVYSFRLLYLVFLGPYQGPRISVSGIHESPKFMLMAMSMLVVPSALFGYCFAELFIGQLGSWVWESCIRNSAVSYIVLPSAIRQAPLISTILGFLVAYIYYVFRPIAFAHFLELPYLKWFYCFLSRKWYFDDFLGILSHKFMIINSKYFWSHFENGILPYFGPIGLTRLFTSLSVFVDLWRLDTVLIYLKSVFYVFLFLAYIWFVDATISNHLEYLIIIQIIGIVYYLTRLTESFLSEV